MHRHWVLETPEYRSATQHEASQNNNFAKKKDFANKNGTQTGEILKYCRVIGL